MIYPWKLKYWQTGEWQVVNERLHDMEKAHVQYNPRRSELFKPLRSLKPEEVSVCILGQDPYPDGSMATGVAFSIPEDVKEKAFPKTLQNIFKEYSRDLGYQIPSHGNLGKWQDQGVLLWNAVPSCEEGKSLSHDWNEWTYLTSEIIDNLSARGGIVFVFLGSVAGRYRDRVDLTNNTVLSASHPSPRGMLSSRTPFVGSGIFTNVNDALANFGKPPINWRLDDAEGNRSDGEGGEVRSGLV